MQRVKRRWWTWTISLIAGVVIFGAVVSGVFQLAVLAVPSYRTDLTRWVSEVAGRDVEIDGISLSWWGLSPRFDLTGITLYGQTDADQISVDRLSLGISLPRLVTGQWTPTRLELAGLRIAARLDADGRIRIAGFEPGDTQQASFRPGRWLESLDRFDHVEIRNCELRIEGGAPDGGTLRLNLDDIALDNTGHGFEVAGDLRLPPSRGGAVHLTSEIRGDIGQVNSWQGGFEIDVSGLHPQGWLQHRLLPGTQVLARDLELQMHGRIVSGTVDHARLEFSSGAVVLARAGVLSSAHEARGAFDWQRQPQGWRLDIVELDFDGQPLARGGLQADTGSAEMAYNLDADSIDLTRLAPWAGVWRDAPEWMQVLGRGSGRVDGVVLRYRQARPSGSADSPGQPPPSPQFTLSARLRDLGLRPDRHFGFSGLSGELSADEAGGRVRIVGVPLVIEAPSALAHPVPFASVSTDLRWRRAAAGWSVSAGSFDWRLASCEGRGQLAVALPADGVPQLSLDADFSVGNPRDLMPYMPRHWPADLQQWLRDGVEQARVPQGELHIHGPLLDFPYHKRPTGKWALDADVVDGRLRFAPDWPVVDQIQAHLAFTRNGMSIQVDQGRIGDTPVQHASAVIEDFDEHLLTVDGQVASDLARDYAFLRSTPLHRPLSGLLDATQARGSGQLDLHLEIPLRDVHDTRVAGTLRLADAQLRYGALDPPVTGLSGTLAFTEHGVTAKRIDGRFGRIPLVLRIDARQGTHGVVHGRFGFVPHADGEGASKFVPQALRPALSGGSVWQLELPLQRADTALTLRSRLIGTAVDLPPPLGKDAATPAPISIRIGAGDDRMPVRIAVGYDRRLAIDLGLGDGDRAGQLLGLHMRTGVDSAPHAQAGRFVLDGSVDRLDIGDWVGFIVGQRSEQNAGEGLRIDRIDLDAAHLVWLGQQTQAVQFHYRPVDTGWRIDLSGSGADGTLQWKPDNRGSLTARFKNLRIAQPEASHPETASAAGDEPEQSPARDPASLPVIDLRVDRMQFGGHDLGQLVMTTSRVDGGQQLQQFRIGGGLLDLDARGAWRRVAGRSSAELGFHFDSRDVSGLLRALGYAENIEAEKSAVDADLSWVPSAAGLRWELAQGTMKISADKGQLRAVDPGASRVLGLINFYALPRRLALDFKDVTGRGLAFDRIKGSFRMADGDARTDDLTVEGPSLRMDIRGRIGLLRRDYDQRVTVYPDVSAGVTLGAALLGGPALGALVLLAQQILDKPLDQATQLTYRITGPWDNPQVDKGQGEGRTRVVPK